MSHGTEGAREAATAQLLQSLMRLDIAVPITTRELHRDPTDLILRGGVGTSDSKAGYLARFLEQWAKHTAVLYFSGWQSTRAGFL